MKKIFTIVVFLFCFILSEKVVGQERDSVFLFGTVIDGDTIPHMEMPEIVVLPKKEFKNARQERRYNRYVNKVKKVYPYAVLAREMLKEYEPKFISLESDKERRKLMRDLEKQLLAEYKDDLKRMTISEGRILLKLIDRETTRTSYSLIKDFRGGVPAVFWQGLARIFGGNLKAEYDPNGEDKLIEEVVTLIEAGYI